jgi:hypothetical protein
MPLSLRHKFSRLPKRLPVGSTFVIEGRTVAGVGDGEKNRHLQVFTRFIVLPGGRRIELGCDASGSARNRRAREWNRPARPQRRSGGAKKIVAGRGTTRRHCR